MSSISAESLYVLRRTASLGILEEMLFLVCLFDLFGKTYPVSK